MAYDRDAFKNAIEEHIGFALLEFYRAKLAMRSRSAGWTADRIAKICDRLERSIVVTILHDIRGFTDRHGAIEEAINEVKRDDEKFRRVADAMILTASKARRLRTSISDEDSSEFWVFLDAAVEVGFQAASPE